MAFEQEFAGVVCIVGMRDIERPEAFPAGTQSTG